MSEIFVLVEHRKGEIRDITWEMLSKGKQIAESQNSSLTAILLGNGVKKFAEEISAEANETVLVENELLENFNSETYQPVLADLLEERKPLLLLIGHTAAGIDLAPSLAAQLNLPLVTDCIELDFEGDQLAATRQIYGGKVNARVVCQKNETYLATIRSGVFSSEKNSALNGTVSVRDFLFKDDRKRKRFIEYVEAEAAEVDISQADVIVSVGRGIKEEKNIKLIEDLAQAIGGTLACSRPIVDKNWLPKSRQVGTSGKTVKPKLYLAVGISGTFQHLAGIKGAGTVVAINKDPKAPFFNVADYGIVEDLFKVVPVLTEKIEEGKKE